MTRVINEITEGVQVSSSNTYEVHRLMDELLKETEKMNSILASINKLSNSTKILGLNASIEAARAGAAGRGFSVVAKEIERLSNNTTEAATEIGEMLASIIEQLNTIGSKSQETTDAFMQQAASLEEIAASMDTLNSNVKVIENHIQQL
jgi:methyl-accepting chemotaxis protein